MRYWGRHRVFRAWGRAAALAVAMAGVATAADLPRFDASRLVDVGVLRAWHEAKDRGGPTFAGSLAWRSHMAFVEDELRARGVVDLRRETIAYRRWFAPDSPARSHRNLRIDGRDVPVASYWAYSGATDPGGVTAPLLLYEKDMAATDFAGRIVVFDVGGPPASMAPAFDAGNEYATRDMEGHDPSLASDQWFQGNFVTRFGRFDKLLKGSGAAGAIVIFDMSPRRARGLYTFPLLAPGVIGVPGVYVDRVAGHEVRDAARAGREATLTLVATEEDSTAYFLSGYLPGRDYGTPADETVLLVTHSEGPNLTQENGTLGIVAVVDYFAGLPREARRRSLLLLFDPQHYMPGRHTVHWYEDHPHIVERVVGSVGVEQLGQLEYAESGDDFALNGLAEPTLIFVQDNVRLIETAVAAVANMGMPRTEVRVPSRGGQGMWAGLGDFAVKYNRPGFAISSAMSGYWTTTPGMESFDAALAHKQVGVVVILTGELMAEDLDEIAVPIVDVKKNPALSPGTRR